MAGEILTGWLYLSELWVGLRGGFWHYNALVSGSQHCQGSVSVGKLALQGPSHSLCCTASEIAAQVREPLLSHL